MGITWRVTGGYGLDYVRQSADVVENDISDGLEFVTRTGAGEYADAKTGVRVSAHLDIVPIVTDNHDGFGSKLKLRAKTNYHVRLGLDAVTAIIAGEKVEFVQYIEGLQRIDYALVAIGSGNTEFFTGLP